MGVALLMLPSSTCRPLCIVDPIPIADEKLMTMMEAVDRLMNRCYDTAGHTSVAIRRWLRSKLTDQPYKAPFQLEFVSAVRQTLSL